MTTASMSMANPEIFIDAKTKNLISYSDEVQSMQANSSDEVSEFIDAITEVMYRIEGISHFTITNFYTFDYLNYNSDAGDKSSLADSSDVNVVDIDYNQLITLWYSKFTGYNAVLLNQLGLSKAKIESLNKKRDIDLSSYVENRFNFLQARLSNLDE